MHSFQDAKIQGKNGRSQLKSGRDVDISNGEQCIQGEPSATSGKEPMTSKTGNSVLSGPNASITDSVKTVLSAKVTHSILNVKDGPKRGNKSKNSPCRNYYMPSNDTKTFQINNKGQLSVYKTSTSSTSPMTRANCQAAGKPQSTMNQVQYHAGQLKT